MSKKKSVMLMVLIIILLGVTACSNSEDANAKNKQPNNENEQEVSNNEQTNNTNENTTENNDENTANEQADFRTDLGNPKVWFGGEVHVRENEIIVEGKSNLLPETTIKSGAISDG